MGMVEADQSFPHLPLPPLATPTILRQDSLIEVVVVPATCPLHPGTTIIAGGNKRRDVGGPSSRQQNRGVNFGKESGHIKESMFNCSFELLFIVTLWPPYCRCGENNNK